MKLWHTIPGPLWMLSRLTTALILLAFVSGTGVSAQETPYPGEQDPAADTPVSAATPAAATPAAEPTGIFFTPEEIAAFAAEFDDNPLIGGQVAPRLSRWVTDDVFLFLQFDNADPAQGTRLPYIGIGVKGVFCAEDQPDHSFTHFHRYDAPEYKEGHGGDPGAEGYWLTWAAVDTFETRDGRQVTPGIDYEFSPTPPPSCGADVPEPAFSPEGAHRLNPEEVATLASLFNDPTLTGGQVPPRLGKWVNEDNFIFVQLDDLEAPTAVRYFGVGSIGTFCAEAQPSTDFTHYHRFHAPEYREGHAGEPGEEDGFWLLWIAADTFEARDGRQIVPGVDREFSPTPPPVCGEGVATPSVASTASLTVTATEWRFDPATLHLRAGQSLTLSVTNTGAELHTFTVPKLGIDSGPLQPGATRELTFTAPPDRGRYDALCTFPGHEEAGMIGSLVVE
jgi:plastocyanin